MDYYSFSRCVCGVPRSDLAVSSFGPLLRLSYANFSVFFTFGNAGNRTKTKKGTRSARQAPALRSLALLCAQRRPCTAKQRRLGGQHEAGWARPSPLRCQHMLRFGRRGTLTACGQR